MPFGHSLVSIVLHLAHSPGLIIGSLSTVTIVAVTDIRDGLSPRSRHISTIAFSARLQLPQTGLPGAVGSRGVLRRLTLLFLNTFLFFFVCSDTFFKLKPSPTPKAAFVQPGTLSRPLSFGLENSTVSDTR